MLVLERCIRSQDSTKVIPILVDECHRDGTVGRKTRTLSADVCCPWSILSAYHPQGKTTRIYLGGSVCFYIFHIHHLDALLTYLLAYPSLNRAPRFSISHADGQNVKWDPRVSFMEGQKRKGMEICEQEEDEEVIFVDIQGNNAGNLTYTYS